MQFDKAVRKATLGLALAATCALPFGARAATESGQFAVKGIGIQACGEFTKAYEARDRGVFVFAGWVNGYITAVNRTRSGTFDAAPWQSIDILLALINNHCVSSPDDRLFGVVQSMLGYYEDQSLAENSPAVELAVADRKVTVYKEVLRRAQERLAAAGVYDGTPDGLFGPKTQAAFEAYQQQNNLPTTGLPDQQTLVRLFARSQPAQ